LQGVFPEGKYVFSYFSVEDIIPFSILDAYLDDLNKVMEYADEKQSRIVDKKRTNKILNSKDGFHF